LAGLAGSAAGIIPTGQAPLPDRCHPPVAQPPSAVLDDCTAEGGCATRQVATDGSETPRHRGPLGDVRHRAATIGQIGHAHLPSPRGRGGGGEDSAIRRVCHWQSQWHTRPTLTLSWREEGRLFSISLALAYRTKQRLALAMCPEHRV